MASLRTECFSGTVFSELLWSALFQMNFRIISLLECFVVWTNACIFSYDLGFLLVCISHDSATATGLLFWLI